MILTTSLLNFKDGSSDKLTEDWIWLVGTDKTPILVSAIGDIFLSDDKENIYWLDVGQGKLEMVAIDKKEFERKLTDIEQVNEWFMIDLTRQLRLSDKKLKDGQIYSYKKLPVIGGDYSVDNFEPTAIEVHFSFAGQIHKQIKDLPDGTKVNVKFES